MNNDNNKIEATKKAQRRKALWWSLLWANVAMLCVLLLTFLFQWYLYKELSSRTLVDIAVNPLIVALGYIVGMLVLWGIIYKYETSDSSLDQGNENHNIY